MDVVADRCAVLALVVVTKDEELLALADRNLRQQGKEVVWHAQRVLAHDTAGMRTGGVEVPQQRGVPLLDLLVVLASLLRVVALSFDGVCNGTLDGGLCAAVYVGRADGAVFRDGDHVGDARRIAVDGRGRREDDVCDIVLDHGGEKRNRAADVDAVVCEGDLARLSNGLGLLVQLQPVAEERTHLQSSKVDDIVDVWVLLKHLVERGLICNVDLVKGRSLAADELDTVHDFWGGVVEVVDDDDLVVCLEEGKGCEGANVAGSTAPSSVPIERDAFA